MMPREDRFWNVRLNAWESHVNDYNTFTITTDSAYNTTGYSVVPTYGYGQEYEGSVDGVVVTMGDAHKPKSPVLQWLDDRVSEITEYAFA